MCLVVLPWGDGRHGWVLVAEPHPVVVADLPGRDEQAAVIQQQPLVVWEEKKKWVYCQLRKEVD